MTRTRQPEDSDAFYEFWCEYPRADGKRAARKAYKSAQKRANAADILIGLRVYRFSPEVQYQPLAATWLNGDRWLREDDIPPPTTIPGPPRRPSLEDGLAGILGDG